jgi:hypothetical protein
VWEMQKPGRYATSDGDQGGIDVARQETDDRLENHHIWYPADQMGLAASPGLSQNGREVECAMQNRVFDNAC